MHHKHFTLCTFDAKLNQTTSGIKIILVYIKALRIYLIVLPVSASIVQVQWRLLSYGAGYPGDSIRPDTAPVMWPPHSAARTQDRQTSFTHSAPLRRPCDLQLLYWLLFIRIMKHDYTAGEIIFILSGEFNTFNTEYQSRFLTTQDKTINCRITTRLLWTADSEDVAANLQPYRIYHLHIQSPK